jgi:hypothetical protein
VLPQIDAAPQAPPYQAEAGAAVATARPAPAIAIAMYFLPFHMIILRRKTFRVV